ncbi:MAG: glutamate formimidoyltransferase [Anaerolineae bacterium]|nr:glutamate formimidoyltransferase [Anaerolineae bacterium]
MTQLVECIPNFSEARKTEVIDQIAAAVTAVKQVHLLDRSSDMDHNRTVLTFVGPLAAIESAAFNAIQIASELINLNNHSGAHPRIGATDVCPIVPLSGVTMEECVESAKNLGKRVGEELGIPVYLYEQAATRPERTNLENIRRGQFEGLKKEIASNPDRKPDYGPSKLGPAGATVIGARNFLIAFNVYLTTDDVSIAKKIAKTIRHSSGGLRYVKGLGLLVDGRAQVSMNLTNFRKTPLALVIETIRREAEHFGVGIHHTELVGMIPQEALIDASVWYTQLDAFSKDQILESKLYAARASNLTPNLASFIDELAAPTPTPGGGSAAAYSAAMGAALVAMVAGLTIDKKKYAKVRAQMQAIRVHAEKLREELTFSVDDDAGAFEAVMGAFRLPKGTGKEKSARKKTIQSATINATHIPLHVAKGAIKIMELALICVESGNLNAISDAASAAALAKAGFTAAGYNVKINVAALPDSSAGKQFLDEIQGLESQVVEIEKSIREKMQERAGFPLE